MTLPEPEQVLVETRDGTMLRADVWDRADARATLVLAHAMMASRRTFVRGEHGGLAGFLHRRGWRVVTFDFRGHGESGTPAARGGDWSYDDLVRDDFPTIVAALRERLGGPIVPVGHSLGGHVALAAQGLGALDADAIVLLAANVWLPFLEPSFRKRIAKHVVLEAAARIGERLGHVPIRRLGVGSDDEARGYFQAFARWWRSSRWTSDDGRDDYVRALGEVRCPVLAMACAGDRFAAPPDHARAFAELVGTTDRTFEALDERRLGYRGGHMELVTDERSAPAWDAIDRWLDARVSGRR